MTRTESHTLEPQDLRREFRRHVAGLSHFALEHLVRELLLLSGYDAVQLTGRTVWKEQQGGIELTASTGTDNLVNSDSVNSINVTFDRQMQVSSFTPAQVLSIVGPNGQINSPQTFTSTGIAKNFAYNGSYELIPKAVASRPATSLMCVDRNAILRDPLAAAQTIDRFLGGNLDVVLMAAEVKPELDRQRGTANPVRDP